MVDVRFEFTTNDPWSVDNAIFVKAFINQTAAGVLDGLSISEE